MVTSLLAFRVGLFEEHVEEASFLYSQRRHLLQIEASSWRDLARFEQRLELHIDALLIGADLALGICRRRAAEGDPGEIYAATSVFCRQRQAALLSEVLGRIDTADPESIAAVADALKYELPQDWSPFVEKALVRQNPRLAPLLATACGYRRIPCAKVLAELLPLRAGGSRAIVRALGRLRSQAAEQVLRRCLADEDPSVRAEALVSLLRTGLDEPLRGHYLVAQKESWPRIALGLGGDASALHALMQPVASGHMDINALHAIGLLGVPGSLRYLCDILGEPALADAAAQAMNWICGADLFEPVFVEEPVNEDELFPRELKVWRQYRDAPRAADGKPFGTSTSKLSTDPARWNRWFKDNASRFDPNWRYRRGLPYSPHVLVQTLASDATDARLRRLTAHELVIRYGCDIPFETDMPVRHQLAAIGRITDWVKDRADAFQAGRWYLNGQLQ